MTVVFLCETTEKQDINIVKLINMQDSIIYLATKVMQQLLMLEPLVGTDKSSHPGMVCNLLEALDCELF